MMSFARMNGELWAVRSEGDLDELRARNATYYCYEGYDCAQRIEWQKTWGHVTQDIHANSIVLRFDRNEPSKLELQYHLVDPRFSSLSTVYREK